MFYSHFMWGWGNSHQLFQVGLGNFRVAKQSCHLLLPQNTVNTLLKANCTQALRDRTSFSGVGITKALEQNQVGSNASSASPKKYDLGQVTEPSTSLSVRWRNKSKAIERWVNSSLAYKWCSLFFKHSQEEKTFYFHKYSKSNLKKYKQSFT